MKMIDAKQIRTLFAFARELGMDADDLHALVSAVTGKDSIKALSEKEANAVTAEFFKRMKKRPVPLKTKPAMTEGQNRKMWALMYRLNDFEEQDRSREQLRSWLSGIAEKSCGKKYSERLTQLEAAKVIEAQKEMLKRREDAGHGRKNDLPAAGGFT